MLIFLTCVSQLLLLMRLSLLFFLLPLVFQCRHYRWNLFYIRWQFYFCTLLTSRSTFHFWKCQKSGNNDFSLLSLEVSIINHEKKCVDSIALFNFDSKRMDMRQSHVVYISNASDMIQQAIGRFLMIIFYMNFTSSPHQ